MNITSIRMVPLQEGRFLATASLCINNSIALPGIRLGKREDTGEYYILMPAQRDARGEYHECFHPISAAVRAQMFDTIIARYKELLDNDSLSGEVKQLSDDETDLKITEIRVYPVNRDNSAVKAFANVTIDNAVALRSIRIVERDGELAVFMPAFRHGNSETGERGKLIDCYHPTSAELRKALSEAVLAEYEKTRSMKESA